MGHYLNAIDRWGGLLGAFGGLIWAVFFYMEATIPEFSLRIQLVNQPVVGFLLFLSVAFQACGYFALSRRSEVYPIPQMGAKISAMGAFGQSLAIFAVSQLGIGSAWLLGILGELVITLALGTFAFSSLATKQSPTIKFLPFLMVPLFYMGWSIDSGTSAFTNLDYINLSAAAYGFLWVPFGITIWKKAVIPI